MRTGDRDLEIASPRRAALWLLEDSPLEARVAQKALSAAFQVDTFADGAALLERLAGEGPPDLVALDWQLSGLRGEEVLHAIRTRFDETTLPVLVVTAGEAVGVDVLTALGAGANDFVLKPYVAAELCARAATLARVSALHRRVLVAERERAEAMVRGDAARAEADATHAHLREIFERAPAAIGLVDGPDHRFTLANARCRELLGREDVVGKTARAVIPEAESQGFFALLDHVRARGEPYVGNETWLELHREQSGAAERVCVNFVCQPLRGADGGVSGIFVHAVDVTELVRAREAARELSRERELAYEVLEHGAMVGVVGPDWGIRYVNEAWEESRKKKREAVLGRTLWEVNPAFDDPSSVVYQHFHHAMNERVSVQFLAYFDVLGAWLELNVYPTLDGGLAVFQRDVTDRKRQEEEAESRAAFERQLIGIVSHDLRNPVAAITFSAATLLRRSDLDTRQLAAITRIVAAADRANRMIRDLLDFTQSRLGAGLVIARAPLDVHELTRQVVDEVSLAHSSRHIEVHTEGDGQGEWDSDRIAQLVTNLVGNALRYSPSNTTVRVTTRGEGDAVLLEVHNDGEPISPEMLPRLFAPMQRGTDRVDPMTRSIGLGLYIVDQIVRAHGGTIHVSSTADTGTTFTVRIPRR